MDTLKDQKQTYKLDMYARLSYTIGAFVALVSLPSAAEASDVAATLKFQCRRPSPCSSYRSPPPSS